MTEAMNGLTESQKQAVALLTRPLPPFEPKSAATLAAEQKAAEARAIANAEIGDLIPRQGVFLGEYAPKDRDGNSLGKIFNVFAAPQDLTDASGKKEVFKYVDAVNRVAELKDWNGFNGTNYATDKELYQALKNGSYDGGWIIPTRDILRGNDVDGQATTPDNLYIHKEKGALAGTFCTAASSGSDFPGWYWSSTENRDTSSGVHNVRFSDGNEDWFLKDLIRLSCRPVRMMEASSPAQRGN